MAQSPPTLVAGVGSGVSVARTAKGSATRAQLIDATIACLAQRGYAGTSTAAICNEAQLTAGALFGHYPNKLALLADTVQTVVGQTVEALSPVADAAVRAAHLAAKRGRSAQAGARPRRSIRLPADLLDAIDHIPAMFGQPAIQALLELRVAARTEPLLAKAFLEDVYAFERLSVANTGPTPMTREGRRLVVMMLHSLLRFVQGSAFTVASLRPAGNDEAVQWEQGACLSEARRICEFWLAEISERSPAV